MTDDLIERARKALGFYEGRMDDRLIAPGSVEILLQFAKQPGGARSGFYVGDNAVTLEGLPTRPYWHERLADAKAEVDRRSADFRSIEYEVIVIEQLDGAS